MARLRLITARPREKASRSVVTASWNSPMLLIRMRRSLALSYGKDFGNSGILSKKEFCFWNLVAEEVGAMNCLAAWMYWKRKWTLRSRRYR